MPSAAALVRLAAGRVMRMGSVHEARYLDAPEHELLGVGREVDLVGDIGHAEPRHVEIDERDGHHERHESTSEVADEAAELSILLRREALLEEAHDVSEHIDMLARDRPDGQRAHEALPVARKPGGARQSLEIAQEATEMRGVDRAVGEEQELVRGVEAGDVLGPSPPRAPTRARA